MAKLLIVDDEAGYREVLQTIFRAEGYSVSTAKDGRSALKILGGEAFNLIVSDVRMPDIDGIETARHLALLPAPPAIIFTTAYDEYALAAFDAQAIGYLLKPVKRDKLEAALATARRLARPELTPLPGGGARRSHFAVRVRDQLKLIPVADVLCCVADQKYVTLHHRGGSDLIEESLRSIEEEFAPDFVRVHRNALAAIRHVAAVDRDAEGHHQVRLRDSPMTLEVSRRLASDVMRRLTAGERHPAG